MQLRIISVSDLGKSGIVFNRHSSVFLNIHAVMYNFCY